jgi:hypothetical protein
MKAFGCHAFERKTMGEVRLDHNQIGNFRRAAEPDS